MAIAYDAARGCTVLFGGHSNGPRYGDTWEYDGATWRMRTPTNAPPPRSGLALVFDPLLGAVVLFGGWDNGYFADTWAWDGVGWSALGSSTVPTPRGNHRMVYDSSRDVVLLHGGNAESGPLADTWEGVFSVRARFETFGTGCAGSEGEPMLSMAPGMEANLGGTFGLDLSQLPPGQTTILLLGASNTLLGGVPLPIPLDGAGMPGCSLHVSGEIALPLANFSGSVHWEVVIPPLPSLVGAAFYLQALVADPPANPAGVIASAGAAVTVGS
jgi:hypothetical protein